MWRRMKTAEQNENWLFARYLATQDEIDEDAENREIERQLDEEQEEG